MKVFLAIFMLISAHFSFAQSEMNEHEVLTESKIAAIQIEDILSKIIQAEELTVEANEKGLLKDYVLQFLQDSFVGYRNKINEVGIENKIEELARMDGELSEIIQLLDAGLSGYKEDQQD